MMRSKTLLTSTGIALILAGCAGPGGGPSAPIEERERAAADVPPSPASVPPVARATPIPAEPPLEIEPLPALDPLTGEAAPDRRAVPRQRAAQALVVAAMEAGTRGEWDRAQAALERAIKHAPDDVGLWTELAYTHFRQGELTQAHELVQRSLALSSASGQDDAAAWRLLADIETARGNTAAAARARAKAASLSR